MLKYQSQSVNITDTFKKIVFLPHYTCYIELIHTYRETKIHELTLLLLIASIFRKKCIKFYNFCMKILIRKFTKLFLLKLHAKTYVSNLSYKKCVTFDAFLRRNRLIITSKRCAEKRKC